MLRTEKSIGDAVDKSSDPNASLLDSNLLENVKSVLFWFILHVVLVLLIRTFYSNSGHPILHTVVFFLAISATTVFLSVLFPFRRECENDGPSNVLNQAKTISMTFIKCTRCHRASSCNSLENHKTYRWNHSSHCSLNAVDFLTTPASLSPFSSTPSMAMVNVGPSSGKVEANKSNKNGQLSAMEPIKTIDKGDMPNSCTAQRVSPSTEVKSLTTTTTPGLSSDPVVEKIEEPNPAQPKAESPPKELKSTPNLRKQQTMEYPKAGVKPAASKEMKTICDVINLFERATKMKVNSNCPPPSRRRAILRGGGANRVNRLRDRRPDDGPTFASVFKGFSQDDHPVFHRRSLEDLRSNVPSKRTFGDRDALSDSEHDRPRKRRSIEEFTNDPQVASNSCPEALIVEPDCQRKDFYAREARATPMTTKVIEIEAIATALFQGDNIYETLNCHNMTPEEPNIVLSSAIRNAIPSAKPDPSSNKATSNSYTDHAVTPETSHFPLMGSLIPSSSNIKSVRRDFHVNSIQPSNNPSQKSVPPSDVTLLNKRATTVATPSFRMDQTEDEQSRKLVGDSLDRLSKHKIPDRGCSYALQSNTASIRNICSVTQRAFHHGEDCHGSLPAFPSSDIPVEGHSVVSFPNKRSTHFDGHVTSKHPNPSTAATEGIKSSSGNSKAPTYRKQRPLKSEKMPQNDHQIPSLPSLITHTKKLNSTITHSVNPVTTTLYSPHPKTKATVRSNVAVNLSYLGPTPVVTSVDAFVGSGGNRFNINTCNSLGHPPSNTGYVDVQHQSNIVDDAQPTKGPVSTATNGCCGSSHESFNLSEFNAFEASIPTFRAFDINKDHPCRRLLEDTDDISDEITHPAHLVVDIPPEDELDAFGDIPFNPKWQ